MANRNLLLFPACENLSSLKIYVDIDDTGMKRKLIKTLQGKCQLVDDLLESVDVIVSDVFIEMSKEQKYYEISGRNTAIVTRYCIDNFIKAGRHACNGLLFHHPVICTNVPNFLLFSSVNFTFRPQLAASVSFMEDLIDRFGGIITTDKSRAIPNEEDILYVSVAETSPTSDATEGATFIRTTVRPDWLVESIKIGKLQTLSEYSLYTKMAIAQPSKFGVQKRERLIKLLADVIPKSITLSDNNKSPDICGTVTGVKCSDDVKGQLEKSFNQALAMNIDCCSQIDVTKLDDRKFRFCVKFKEIYSTATRKQSELWGSRYGIPNLMQFHVVIVCKETNCKNVVCSTLLKMGDQRENIRIKHVDGDCDKFVSAGIPVVVDINEKLVIHYGFKIYYKSHPFSGAASLAKFASVAFSRARSSFALKSNFL